MPGAGRVDEISQDRRKTIQAGPQLPLVGLHFIKS
jgi:hypothetical protein